MELEVRKKELDAQVAQGYQTLSGWQHQIKFLKKQLLMLEGARKEVVRQLDEVKKSPHQEPVPVPVDPPKPEPEQVPPKAIKVA